MELSTVKDTFDRVSKKQTLSSSKTQELIDKIIKEIKSTITKLQSPTTTATDHTMLLQELSTKLAEISPTQQLESSHKELNLALTKYTKLLEKNFTPDISKAYRNADFDPSTINLIVATHFYREGSFELGDTFVQESSNIDPSKTASLKSSFLELFQISQAIKSGNIEPALSWAVNHHDRLQHTGWSLELKLHQLQFVEILKKGSGTETQTEALAYARKYLAPFASDHKIEIQQLMASLLWAGKLDQSPYVKQEFISPESTYRAKIAEELKEQFCELIGQSYESPLKVVITAGFQGLPTLLKLVTVMATNKRQEWQTMEQLPVPIELGREFQFHSVFVCPVLREQGSKENPPMLMPCGHVISKQSIAKLSKSNSRPFKCPYCPSEAHVAQCKQLHF